MGKQSFTSMLREFFGGLAFRFFLWSIGMTQDEYLNTVVAENIDNNHSFYMRCWDCYMWGTPIPENTDTCGNCGGHNITIYYPSTTVQPVKKNQQLTKQVKDLQFCFDELFGELGWSEDIAETGIDVLVWARNEIKDLHKQIKRLREQNKV